MAKKFDRRDFIKLGSLSAIPFLVPMSNIVAKPRVEKGEEKETIVSFIGDGEKLSPIDYLKKLEQINIQQNIEPDSYGKGGAVSALEEKFAKLTGKESAIFVPTGTLANQLAISELSEDRTKVFVQDTSHIYRDEADAAQSVFGKRLMPLGIEQTYFTVEELKKAIDSLSVKEVFRSGIGAVAIENPVRRKMGAYIPLEEIEKIHSYCKEKQIKMHLDGARVFLASAWSGVSIKTYSQYFDTVYISLYKYLGAGGGAVLCGDKEFIDKIPHLIKVHGGTIYQNWMNAAMALSKLEEIEDTLKKVVSRSESLLIGSESLKDLKIEPIENGTNIYLLAIDKSIDPEKFTEYLKKTAHINIIKPNAEGKSILMMNETILKMDTSEILKHFEAALKASR